PSFCRRLITRDQQALFAQAPCTSTTVGFACVVFAGAAVERPARVTGTHAVSQTAVIMAASFIFERWTISASAAELGLPGWFISLSLLLVLSATRCLIESPQAHRLHWRPSRSGPRPRSGARASGRG